MRSDVTILLNARDLFSTLGPCVENLLAHTDPHVAIRALIGGAPTALREQWQRDYGKRVHFQFDDHFLGQAQARNRALAEIDTPLAVTMDTDVFVWPGWLEALLDCQRATGAMMVVPLILERPRRIHCAGCDLYITHEAGRSYGHKFLRFFQFPFAESCNLERSPTDYGELHCQLVQVEPTLRLGAYDEQIPEVGEVDSGLTWSRGGGSLWFEPTAVVHFVEDAPIRACDVHFFAWRWDMHRILEGYRYFENKWGFDISEHGEFKNFLFRRNRRLGWLPRWWPSELSLRLHAFLERWLWRGRHLFGIPDRFAEFAHKRGLGYFEWPRLQAQVDNERRRSHPALAHPSAPTSIPGKDAGRRA